MIRRVIGLAIVALWVCAGRSDVASAQSPHSDPSLWDRLPLSRLLNKEQQPPPEPEQAQQVRTPPRSSQTRRSLLELDQQNSPERLPAPTAAASQTTEAQAPSGHIKLNLWNKSPSETPLITAPTPRPEALHSLREPNIAPGIVRADSQLRSANWLVPEDPPDSPIMPLSYEVGTELSGETDQIAKPMFAEVLDDAARPGPIVTTGWETDVEDWIDAEDFEPPEWLFWENGGRRSGFIDRLLGFGPRDPRIDVGIGRERVVFGTFEIDPSQPWNNVRVRYDAVYSLPTPDRIQYFWAKSGNGPDSAGEVVDYQEFRIYSEVGGSSASVITEYPIRAVDPTTAGNTTGFGDMVVGNKAVMVDGRDWQITQVFRTYINTGSVKKGLGNGHVSMEPGVLARYEWTEDTYVHGEFKFWFPVGAADMAFSGQVLRYGIGLTHVGYDNDVFALIHDVEFVGMTFLDGQKTIDGIPMTVDVDGETVGTWLYGMHFVLGPAGDLGLFEVGLAAGVGTGVDWYDGLFRLDFRWNY